MNDDAIIELADDGKRSRYQRTYDSTRTMTLTLSGLSVEQIEAAATELQVDLEVFLLDYAGPRLSDDHEYFVEMLRQWDLPWAADEWSALNGLSLAQFFLAWSWKRNAIAQWLLTEAGPDDGWTDDTAVRAAVRAAVSAAKSLAHAKALMASGENKLAQGAL